MKPASSTFLLVGLVLLALGLWDCRQKETTPHEPNESRLKERISAARAHFLKGEFDAFIEMRSERMRSTMFETEEEKQKGLKEWKMFLSREKPTFELLGVEITGNRAIAKMRASIVKVDGPRSTSTLYDLWVFENGDWFLDTADRTSPEYFKK